MPPVTLHRFHRALQLAIFAVAVPSFAGAEATPAQVVDSAGECATRRAREDLERVHAAMLAWYLDAVSGLVPLAGRAAVGAPLCPGGPAIDLRQVPRIAVEDLRSLLVPQYIAAVPAFDPWERSYEYRLNLPDLLDDFYLAVRSSGADGLYSGVTYEIGATSGPADDLVIFNTTWLREPPRLDPVSRQQVTLERIDTLGAAMVSYWTDVISGAPRAPTGGPSVDLTLIDPIAAPDLAALLLTPFYYTLCVPAADGWGHPFDYRLNDDPLTAPFMSIRSAGRDGVMEGEVYDIELFPADDLDRDLVWSDGQAYRSPAATRVGIFIDDFETGALWGTWSCGPGF